MNHLEVKTCIISSCVRLQLLEKSKQMNKEK